MKKIGIILILIVFPLCLLAGYRITGIVFNNFGAEVTATPPAAPAVPLDSTQQIFFMIHVDRLDAPQPQLISVWIMFALISDPPSLTFVPLIKAGENAAATDTFAILPDRTLAPEFLTALRNLSGVQNHAYMILDDQALISFASSFARMLNGHENSGPDGEQLAIHGLCDMLRMGEIRMTYEIPWGEIVPNHFKTDMLLDNFMDAWLRISRGKNAPVCDQVLK